MLQLTFSCGKGSPSNSCICLQGIKLAAEGNTGKRGEEEEGGGGGEEEKGCFLAA